MTLKFENPGYVYILSNESLKGLKIGYTQNSPYSRSEDLFTTGVPTPFIVEHFFFVEDAMLCEELVHTRLNRFRIDNSREFFRVDVPKAIRTVEQAIDDLRERLWSKAEMNVFKSNDLKQTDENKEEVKQVPLVNQSTYSNPKFTEMMKVMKQTRGLMTSEEIAGKIKISKEGVEKLIKMMSSIQGSTMLYSREENRVKKYSMALSFNVHQLTLLAERYPALNLMELKPLFEKQKNQNKNTYRNNNNGRKPVQDNETKTVAEFIKGKVDQSRTTPNDDPLSKENIAIACKNVSDVLDRKTREEARRNQNKPT